MLVYPLVLVSATAIAAISGSVWRRQHGSILPRKLSIGAVAVIIILAGTSSLRSGVGTDYWAYHRNFEEYANEVPDNLSLWSEPGVRIIAWVAMGLTNDSTMMFAIAAFISIGLLVWSLWRWSPAFAFSILLFILSGVWHGTFNGIRQYLACAVLFAGHRYIQSRSFWKWFAIVLIASMFHISAIVALLLYLVPSNKTSAKIQLTLILLGVIGMLGMGALIDLVEQFTGDTDRWSSDYAARGVNPLRIVFAFVPVALYWLLDVKDKVKEQNSGFYINMLVLYGVAYLASSNSAMVARFVIYLLPFLSIGLVYVTQLKDPRERWVIRAAVVLLFAAFFYVEISGSASLREFNWVFERK